AKMDQGPILNQATIKIGNRETTPSLTKKLAISGSNLLVKTICPFLTGKILPKPQNHSQATYTKIIKKEDGQINWQQPAEQIARKIRAYFPWPGTFTFWQNLRLKITEAEVIDVAANPGKTFVNNKQLAIGTSTKSLLIKKIQPEGKKTMDSADFLKGNQKIIGKLLI
ncbi:methionyl-tRNA formyltransferase, partial [Patescibacteria group bacterium]|nr:methionyl-tRNA formyltransferase [Patescibacteria group bacterium]